MTQEFQTRETFKRGIIVVKDMGSHQWNYIVEDFSFGYMPPVKAGSWTDHYDVDEDGDNKGELHFTRYIFEAKTPLAVRKEAVRFFQSLVGQFENNNYTINKELWF